MNKIHLVCLNDNSETTIHFKNIKNIVDLKRALSIKLNISIDYIDGLLIYHHNTLLVDSDLVVPYTDMYYIFFNDLIYQTFDIKRTVMKKRFLCFTTSKQTLYSKILDFDSMYIR